MVENTLSQEPLRLESREPLIVFPDRRISLLYVDHGKVEAGIFYRPFTDRLTTEKEIAAVFPAGADCLVSDSFPGEKSLTPAMVATALAMEETTLHLHAWAIKYAAKHRLTLVAADPLARSEELFKLTSDELLADKKGRDEADEVYYRKWAEVENSPRYRELDNRLRAVTGLGFGADFLLGPSAFGVLVQALELAHGKKLDRREFLKIMGLTALSGTTLGLKLTLQSWESWLLNQENKLRLQLRQELGLPPSLRFGLDLPRITEIFSQDKELTMHDFEDPATLRRIDFNRNLKILIGLRNALIARTLTLPKETLSPWSSRNQLDMVVVMGFDHVIVPEEMRFPTTYIIRKSPTRYLKSYQAPW